MNTPISLTEPQGLTYCLAAEEIVMAGPLRLFKRYSVTLPQGTISQTGRDLIYSYIAGVYPKVSYEWQELNPGNTIIDLPSLPDDWLWVWNVKNSEKDNTTYGVGKFTTRVERFYKKKNLKCPKKFLEYIGMLARDNSAEDISFHFDFVNRIDWDDGDFGDDDSCWWSSYDQARDTLTDSGGLAIRFFTDAKQNIGIGRAWLAPFKDMFVLFNGYGFDNATLLIAKLVASHLGHGYKKVGLDNWNDLMYINNDNGFLIGPPNRIVGHSDVSLEFGDRIFTCDHCDCDMTEDDEYQITPNGSRYCNDCFNDHYSTCECCDGVFDQDDMTEVAGGGSVCDRCRGRHYTSCDECDTYYPDGEITHIDGSDYCDSCRDDECTECSKCNEWRANHNIIEDSDPVLCEDCAPDPEKEE